MNDKLFNEIKLKMVMKIHRLSRQAAKEKIMEETSINHSASISYDDGEDLISAEDLFDEDEFQGV